MITYLNAVTLAGVVRSLKTTKLSNDLFVYRFIITIVNVYKSKDNDATTDIEYFQVSYYSSSSEDFKEGDNIKIEGKLANQKYVSNNGEERTYCGIVARKVIKL